MAKAEKPINIELDDDDVENLDYIRKKLNMCTTDYHQVFKNIMKEVVEVLYTV